MSKSYVYKNSGTTLRKNIAIVLSLAESQLSINDIAEKIFKDGCSRTEKNSLRDALKKGASNGIYERSRRGFYMANSKTKELATSVEPSQEIIKACRLLRQAGYFVRKTRSSMPVFFIFELNNNWDFKSLETKCLDGTYYSDLLSSQILDEEDFKRFISDRLYYSPDWGDHGALIFGLDISSPPPMGTKICVPDAYWPGEEEFFVHEICYQSTNNILVFLKEGFWE